MGDGDRPARRRFQPLREFASEVFSDHVQTAAAALAFHAMFGVLPALAAAAAIWGMIAGLDSLREPVAQGAEQVLRDDAAVALLVEFVTAVPQGFGLGVGLALNLVVALWAAQRAASGLLSALNIAYDKTEHRSWARREAVAIALALATLLLLTVALALIALPPLLAGLARREVAGMLEFIRWPAIVLVFALGVGALYSFAPSRERPRNEMLSRGTLAATLLWIAASAGLSFYVGRAAGFGVFYGSLGGGVVLMLWFYLTALAVLAGAEVNALRREAAAGRPDPMKRRLRAREGREDEG